MKVHLFYIWQKINIETFRVLMREYFLNHPKQCREKHSDLLEPIMRLVYRILNDAGQIGEGLNINFR